MHANLFSNWQSSLLTALSGLALVVALWFGLGWILFDADWTVIGTLGGQMVIGQYNTDAACPDNNCFWRPQAALLMVTMLLGMAWGVAGGGTTKRIAIAVAIALAAFAFLPYSMERMGLDVRILLLANLPALAAGWAIARYTPLGTPRWIAIVGVAVFVLTVLLLRGVDGIPGLEPVSVILLGRSDAESAARGGRNRAQPAHRYRARPRSPEPAACREAALRSLHRGLPRRASHHAALHVAGARAPGLP